MAQENVLGAIGSLSDSKKDSGKERVRARLSIYFKILQMVNDLRSKSTHFMIFFHFKFKIHRVSLHLLKFLKVFENCFLTKIYRSIFPDITHSQKFVCAKLLKFLIPENFY